MYRGLSNLFSLKPYFLANSKLITSPIVPLSNNAFILIPFYVSILSKPIFTVTSLKRSPLSRLHEDIFSATLLSIANLLLLLRSSWDLLDLYSHLNCYCLLLAPFFCLFPFSYSYSILPNIQNPYKYNNLFLCQYP